MNSADQIADKALADQHRAAAAFVLAKLGVPAPMAAVRLAHLPRIA